MTHVTVSVISTAEGARLASCLQSLAAQRFNGTLSVVVVQNGVDDDTDVVARRIIPDAHVLRNGDRRGFAENHNAALREVPADFGLILNPDVILAPDCVGELLGAMQRHPRAAVIAPLLSYPSGRPQPSARMFPRFAGTLLRRTPLRRFFAASIARSAHYLPVPDGDRAIDWALGACLFVRATAWNELGGFDAKFDPLYVEDVDLGWRTWLAGWEFWQTPLARAVHEHQAATDRVFFDRRTLWHLRGMMRFVRKHPRILFNAERPAPVQRPALG